MSDKICTYCNFKNDSGSDACVNCGALLTSRAVVIRPDAPVVMNSRPLPSKNLKRLGASVLISAAALLVELGVIYLQRRLRTIEVPKLQSKGRRNLPVAVERQPGSAIKSGKRIISVYRERVVEERRWGRPARRIIDRVAWRSEETLES